MTKLKTLLLTLPIVALTACAPKLSDPDTQTSNKSLSNPQDDVDQVEPIDKTQEWNKLSFEGNPEGGSYSKQLVIKLDKPNQAIVLTLPIPIGFIQFPNLNVPELPGAKLAFQTQVDGSKALVISVPLVYLVKGAILGSESGLPNGDPLPGYPDGELPNTSLTLPALGWKVYIYLGVQAVAAFVEVPGINIPSEIGSFLPSQITYPVKNKTKTKIIGYLSFVGPKTGFPGGAYLAAQLPNDIAASLTNILD